MLPTLAETQRWLLEAITSSSEAAATQTQQWITSGPDQSADQRLVVYRQAYLARLLEVLQQLLPCTRFAAGHDLFDQLMTGYVQACPPHSYTLSHLADRLVEHLDATRPSDWGEFLVELVQLELAIDRVFDAVGGERLPGWTLPPEPSELLKLSLTPGHELLAFRFPVSTFYSDWKAGREPAWPTGQPQFVALVRRDYVVRRYELGAMQFQLLCALQAGKPLGEALYGLVQSKEASVDLAEQVQRWFTFWTAEGFLVAAK